MFKRNVTFVVGAGASKELHMPLGSELKSQLAEGLAFTRQNLSRDGLQAKFHEALRYVHNSEKRSGQLAELEQAAVELTPVFRGQRSVDEALHFVSENPSQVKVGKIGIAAAILMAERATGTLPKDDDIASVREYKARETVWLFQLMSMAIAGRRRSEFAHYFERVTIICFNYDRTIEQYLFHSLQRHAQLSSEEAAVAVSALRILRPYGVLGKLRWQTGDNSSVIPFGGGHKVDVLQEVGIAAGNIRTFTEQFNDADLQGQMHEALRNSQLIIFLGFGFATQNMDLLRLSEEDRRNRSRLVFGTDKDMQQNERSLIAGIHERLNAPLIELFPMEAHIFLGTYGPTIMQAVGE